MLAVATGTRYRSYAEVLARVGCVPPARILSYPAPGTATPEDAFNPKYVGERAAELVGGILVEKAMGHNEDLIGVRVFLLLGDYLEQNNVGSLSGPQGGYWFKSDLLRIPDVSVVLWDSVEDPDEIEDPEEAFLRTPPDFVVEVLSPSNTRREMEIKLAEYAKAGVQLVWYVDPDRKEVDVFPKARVKGTSTVGVGGTLDGAPVLPGFTLPVAKLFEKRAPAARKGGKGAKGKPKKG
jgi:Uma2 family endonuclease